MCVYCENKQKIELENPVCNSCGININGNEMEVAINYEVAFVKINYCPVCGREVNKKEEKTPPYSYEDYLNAKTLGLELDNWKDYQEFYNLGVISND